MYQARPWNSSQPEFLLERLARVEGPVRILAVMPEDRVECPIGRREPDFLRRVAAWLAGLPPETRIYTL